MKYLIALLITFSSTSYGMLKQRPLATLQAVNASKTLSTRTIQWSTPLSTLFSTKSSQLEDLISRDPSATILTAESPQEWLQEELEAISNEFIKIGLYFCKAETHSLSEAYYIWEEAYFKKRPRITHPYMLSRLEKVNNDFEFDSEGLGIYHSPGQIPSATQRNIELNVENLCGHSNEAIDYILAHERQHQKSFHPLIWNAVNTKLPIPSDDDKEILLRLSRYFEMTADVGTLEKGKEYAHGLMEAIKKEQYRARMNGQFQTIADDHPLDETRLALASSFLE